MSLEAGIAVAGVVISIIGMTQDDDACTWGHTQLQEHDLPDDYYRICLVSLEKSWDRAIKLNQGRFYYEGDEVLKTGSKFGKRASANLFVKYDVKMFKFSDADKGNGEIEINIMKPGFMGVYTSINKICISKEDRPKFNRKTIYIYFDEGKEKHFAGDAKNRLTLYGGLN